MKFLIGVFIFSLILFIVGQVFVFPEAFNVCERVNGYFACIKKYDKYEIYGTVVSLLAPIIFFTSVIIYSYKNKRFAFNSWLRFSKYYLPITAILIFLMPAVDSTIGGFDREFMTWFLAGIFFIVSLGIIIKKSWSLRKTNTISSGGA